MAKERNSWKIILQEAAEDVLSSIGNNVSRRIRTFSIHFERKMGGIFLIFIGATFLLVAFSLLINTILPQGLDYAGWGIVGAAVMLIGYVLSKG